MPAPKNPLRYPDEFFDWLRAIESASLAPFTREFATEPKLKHFRHRLSGFRNALLTFASKPSFSAEMRHRYERFYELSLKLQTERDPQDPLTLRIFAPSQPAPRAPSASASKIEREPATPYISPEDDPIAQAEFQQSLMSGHLDRLRFELRKSMMPKMIMSAPEGCPCWESSPREAHDWLATAYPDALPTITSTSILADIADTEALQGEQE